MADKQKRQFKQERQFGLVFAVFFTLVAFWPLWPLHAPKPGWLAAAAASLVLGIFFPRPLAPLNRAWLAIGHGLGWINSKIILGFVFYIIVTPTAMVMKALGRDLLSRRLRHSGSYWVKRDAGWKTESMRNQF
jgi:heme/copper-type cytochrome/quinol oxidase subunit 4